MRSRATGGEGKPRATKPDAVRHWTMSVGCACLLVLGLTATSPGADDDILLDWSTFFGGQDRDFGWSIATDLQGSVYVVGETFSVDFPLTDDAIYTIPDGNPDTAEGYLVRLSPEGDELLYATFLGGSAHDVCRDVALDEEGDIYIGGITASSDFLVTTDALDDTYGGANDAFLVKLGPGGTQLLYGTYLGGTGEDKIRAISVLAPGFVCVTGYTTSSDFPVTPGAFDETHNGDWDLFITLIDLSSSQILYSTFLGGSGPDVAWDLAVDEFGYAYVVGYTGSSDFPTTVGAFDTEANGDVDGFVAKLGLFGFELSYGTYLGGGELDQALRMALNEDLEVVVQGFTRSSDFPVTSGAFDETLDGEEDGFIAKVTADGSDLSFCTLVGGSGRDRGQGIVLDDGNNILAVGRTYSADFPTAPQPPNHSGSSDIYIVRMQSDGSDLLGGTLIGGSGWEAPWSLVLTGESTVALTGATDGPSYPVSEGSYDEDFNGGAFDGIVSSMRFRQPSFVDAPRQPVPLPALRVYPNPTHGSITTSFMLEKPGPVRLQLTDVRGRSLATLLEGWLREGEHRITGAMDPDGWELPSGIYLLRLTTLEGSRHRKVLISR